MGLLRRKAKDMGSLKKEIASETGIPEEQVTQVVNSLLNHPVFLKEVAGRLPQDPTFYNHFKENLVEEMAKDKELRERIVNVFSDFVGRRSFLAMVGGLATSYVVGTKLAGADTVIPSPNDGTYNVLHFNPFDIIVGKEGKKVKAYNTLGKLIAGGKSGVSAFSPGSDTEVVLNALEYLQGIGGGVLKVSKGDYYIKSGNPIIASNIHLIGAGKGITNFNIVPDQITYSAGLRCLLRNYDINNGDSNFVIKDISFKADNSLFENASFSARAIIFDKVSDAVIEDCDFKTVLRPISGIFESGALFFFGENLSKNIILNRCDFYNGQTIQGDYVDTIFKFDRVFNCKILNCNSYGAGSDGKSLTHGFNYNISGCEYVTIQNCYGEMAKTGIWIEASSDYTLNRVFVIGGEFTSENQAGIGISNNIDNNSNINILGVTIKNVGTQGINDNKIIATVIGCSVFEHALNVTTPVAGIVAKKIITCKVIAESNVYQNGIYPYELAEGNTVKTYNVAVGPYLLSDVSLKNNKFIRVTSNNALSGCINLRFCDNFYITGNKFINTFIRILYDGTNGDGHKITDNDFICPDISSEDIVYANTVPVKLWIEGNKLYNGIQAALVNGKNVIINNINFPTKNFSASGLSVALGSNAYGTPTIYTPPAGFISNFNLILHITAAAGDTVYAKVTTVFENAGETTGVVKEVDNSAGTAAVNQNIALSVEDLQSLWVNNDRLLQIKVYGDSVAGSTSSAVTFDVFGSS